MSLTGFQRYRRMQQVEEMKPENINNEEPKEEVVAPVENTEENPIEVKAEGVEGEVVENPEETPVEEPVEEEPKEEVVAPKPTTRGRGRRA